MKRPPGSCAVFECKRVGSRFCFPGEFAANIIEVNGLERGSTLRQSRMLLRENDSFSAERIGYGSNVHFEIVISNERQEPGQSHAAGPACGAEFRFGTFFWNPAPEDAVAVGVQLRFLRVVSAMIEDAALLLVKDEFFWIELAEFPNHAACR